MENNTQRMAQIILDAADTDIRQFQSRILKIAAGTEVGNRFIGWADTNPLLFQALVRGLSVLIKNYSRNLRGQGLLRDAIADQLNYLPADFQDTVLRQLARRKYSSALNSRMNISDFVAVAELAEDMRKFQHRLESSSAVSTRIFSDIFAAIDPEFKIPAQKIDERLTGEVWSTEQIATIAERKLGKNLSLDDRRLISEFLAMFGPAFVESLGAGAKKGLDRESVIQENLDPQDIHLMLTKVGDMIENVRRNDPEQFKWFEANLTRFDSLLTEWVNNGKPDIYTQFLMKLISSIKVAK